MMLVAWMRSDGVNACVAAGWPRPPAYAPDNENV